MNLIPLKLANFYVRLISEKARQNPHATLDNLHLYGSLPTVLRRLIPDNRLKLGLDLKGGVHLVLEVDLEASKTELLREHTHFRFPNDFAQMIFCAERLNR